MGYGLGPVPDKHIVAHGVRPFVDEAPSDPAIGVRVAAQARIHPEAAVIVVGRFREVREILRALAPYRPALATSGFVEDLPLAMREGVTLYDAAAFWEHGPVVAERTAAIVVEDGEVRVIDRA